MTKNEGSWADVFGFQQLSHDSSKAPSFVDYHQDPVVRSMVSGNHWLSSIKINGLSWYLTLVSANQASNNWGHLMGVLPELEKQSAPKIVIINYDQHNN